jgi:catechol 2,3-dioxygenase
MTVGRVALRVADLSRTVEFYRDTVGLDVLERTADRATLGVDAPLVVLLAAPDAPPRGPREAGLFHTAFRVPSRATLDGASDHLVSEALYLSDPEGNGVELYRDRPRAEWPLTDEGVGMDTRPLALDDLRAAGGGDGGAPPGTTVGHVHLEVSSLSAARAFYADELGLNVRATAPEACFLAVGDYHHHVGLNTWNERTEPATGRELAWFELRGVGVGVGAGERTDPDGMRVRL